MVQRPPPLITPNPAVSVSASVPEAARPAPGATPDAATDALASLRLAQERLGPDDGPLADRLAAVGDELALLQEEVTVQLAEIEAAARARQEERALVRRLVTTLPVALLVTDPSGAVVEANAAAAELLGVPGKTLLRKPVFSYIAPEQRRVARNLLSDAAEGAGSAEGELGIVPRSGPGSRHRVVLGRTVGDPGDDSDQDRISWVLHPDLGERDENDKDTRYLATLVELCRMAATDAGLNGLLRRIADLAADGLPGVAAASVVVGDPAAPTSTAWSSHLAQTADGLQHLAGEGPMFQAFADNEIMTVDDLFDDHRWPRLAHIPDPDRCTGAVLAIPVSHGRRACGAVVLYSDRSAAGTSFAAELAGRAGPYVAAVESLVRDTQALEELAAVRDQLQEALSSRAVIDQAKGMIMMTRGCTAEEAFALLARMSSTSSRKVRELAHDFVAEVSSGKRRFR